MNRRNGSLARIDEEETLTLSSAKLDNISKHRWLIEFEIVNADIGISLFI